MIGALVSLISLEMTRRLVAAAVVAYTYTVTGATTTTPIVLTTSQAHQIPTGRRFHGVVSGVGGMPEANGTWILNVTGPSTLSLTSLLPSGTTTSSAGVGTYTSGGQIQVAFPDGAILLGWRNVDMMSAIASPRVVFVPATDGRWEFDAAAGAPMPPGVPPRLSRETPEQKFSALEPQIDTQPVRFEVHVSGAASPPDPDYGDFDATQSVVQELVGVLFDLVSPARYKVMGAKWERLGLDARGQKWVGGIEILEYVPNFALRFVPNGTVGVINVQLQGAGSSDTVVITLPPPPT